MHIKLFHQALFRAPKIEYFACTTLRVVLFLCLFAFWLNRLFFYPHILKNLIRKEAITIIEKFEDLKFQKQVMLLNEGCVADLNDENRADITQININRREAADKRFNHYIQAVKNPYSFTVGDIGVKLNFSDSGSLSEALSRISSKI